MISFVAKLLAGRAGAWLLYTLLAAGGAALVYAAWHWHVNSLLERGRAEGAAPFIAAGETAKAANQATSTAREQLDTRGQFRYVEAMQAKEKADADRQAADRRRAALVERLRDDLDTARRAAAERPADPGGADGAGLAECRQLLDESAAVVDRLAASAASGGGLVSEGAGLLEAYRAQRQRARDWAEAATLNAPQPQQPP